MSKKGKNLIIEGIESDIFDLPSGCVIHPAGCKILDISKKKDEVEFYINLTFFNPENNYSKQYYLYDIERWNVSISSNEVELKHLTNKRLSFAAIHYICRYAMKNLRLPYINIVSEDSTLMTVYPTAN